MSHRQIGASIATASCNPPHRSWALKPGVQWFGAGKAIRSCYVFINKSICFQKSLTLKYVIQGPLLNDLANIFTELNYGLQKSFELELCVSSLCVQTKSRVFLGSLNSSLGILCTIENKK